MTNIKALPPTLLCQQCDPAQFSFETTAELENLEGLIGQTRAVEAVQFGIGMEPDFMRRLFEPFTQADRSIDRSRGGLGLGLALVKGLVERMDAGISGRNAEGGGFEVSIDFHAA